MPRQHPLRIFLSSTYQDLESYRSIVLDVLHRNGHVYHGMEFFGAAPCSTLEECLAQVEQSDLVICLLALRYGSCPPRRRLSYTELEIRHAIRSGIPILAYFLSDQMPVLKTHIDQGLSGDRLHRLKVSLAKRCKPAYFTTPEDLGMKIARDLLSRLTVDSNTPSQDVPLTLKFMHTYPIPNSPLRFGDFLSTLEDQGAPPPSPILMQQVHDDAVKYFVLDRGEARPSVKCLIERLCGLDEQQVSCNKPSLAFRLWAIANTAALMKGEAPVKSHEDEVFNLFDIAPLSFLPSPENADTYDVSLAVDNWHDVGRWLKAGCGWGYRGMFAKEWRSVLPMVTTQGLLSFANLTGTRTAIYAAAWNSMLWFDVVADQAGAEALPIAGRLLDTRGLGL